MISIKTLRLQNFQTHKDTTFEFSPNFNCIIGQTRSGKSSMVRALDFLFYNEWMSEYQRFGAPNTTITVKLFDDTTIVRVKSKTDNKLTIQTPSGKKVFEGFGVNLPKEFIDIISIFPIEVDSDTSIRANISNQDDPLFLLYDTGTIRTKVFSRLSGLHWIDYALKDLNKDHRNNSTELQQLDQTTNNLKDKLKDFDNIEETIQQLKEARQILDRFKSIDSLIQRGNYLVDRTAKWKFEYQKLQQIKSSLVNLSRFEKAVNLYENVLKKAIDFHNKYSTLTISRENIEKYFLTIHDAKNSTLKQLEGELKKNPSCPTCGSRIELNIFIETECHA